MFGIIERYAVARSNTTDDYNAHTGGSAVAPPPATFLNRYAILLIVMAYLNRITIIRIVFLPIYMM